jgi:hypothetical protein
MLARAYGMVHTVFMNEACICKAIKLNEYITKQIRRREDSKQNLYNYACKSIISSSLCIQLVYAIFEEEQQ